MAIRGRRIRSGREPAPAVPPKAARNLNISPRTVEFHRKNIMSKLGARNVVDLLGIVLASSRPD